MFKSAPKLQSRFFCTAAFGLAAMAIGSSQPVYSLPAPKVLSSLHETLYLEAKIPVPVPRPGSAASGTPSVGSSIHSAAVKPTGSETLPQISRGEKQSLRSALQAVAAGKGSRALAIRKTLKDPVDQKIVDWRLSRSGDPAISSNFITGFTVSSPNWPSQKLLRRRAEQAFAREKPAADAVIAAFKGLKPLSLTGTLLLANAYLDTGNKKPARALISQTWRADTLSAGEERRVLRNFKSLLNRKDHKARADMLLYDDRANGALRLAPFLSKDERKLIDARIAVIRKSRKAAALLKAVPRSQRVEPGYAFARIKYLRRKKKDAEAIKVMLNAPVQKSGLIGGDAWWVERRIVSREALDLGRPKDAYKIAAAHGAVSPAKYTEAEFHAGWYALRFLKDPKRARAHFLNIEKVGKTPITRSRAFYWLGRTAEARKQRSEAQKYYQQAAEYKTAFYGQLAREKLGKNRLGLSRPPKPTSQDRASFASNELVIAIKRLEAAGYGNLTPQFYRKLGQTLTNPGVLALVTQMAQEYGHHRLALMVGKLAVSRGVDADLLAFPTAAIPRKAKVQKDVGKPVVYAIARQESAFNPKAISSAGARGLLQLMPATARATAKKAGLSYSKGRLTSDAAYNATLGAAHLGELLDRFNGSYVLTFAAYNAGSSRSHKWIKEYGDPRKSRVDTIDWIERIPFTETRNYVQRIMENLVIYRARFERDKLQITKDLKRG